MTGFRSNAFEEFYDPDEDFYDPDEEFYESEDTFTIRKDLFLRFLNEQDLLNDPENYFDDNDDPPL